MEVEVEEPGTQRVLSPHPYFSTDLVVFENPRISNKPCHNKRKKKPIILHHHLPLFNPKTKTPINSPSQTPPPLSRGLPLRPTHTRTAHWCDVPLKILRFLSRVNTQPRCTTYHLPTSENPFFFISLPPLVNGVGVCFSLVVGRD